MTFRLSPAPVAALLLATLAVPVLAETAPIHVRGTVATVDGTAVTIKTNDNKTVGLTLGPSWKFGGVAPATVADIKPGTFIGTANVDGPDASTALEVVVFPDAMRGVGEGNYGWDLQPNSKMTNATVNQAVEAVDGPTVTLGYKGGEKKVTIPAGTPIVKIVPGATADDVKPGIKVFAAGTPNADGTQLSEGTLVVGKDGATPPM